MGVLPDETTIGRAERVPTTRDTANDFQKLGDGKSHPRRYSAMAPSFSDDNISDLSNGIFKVLHNSHITHMHILTFLW